MDELKNVTAETCGHERQLSLKDLMNGHGQCRCKQCQSPLRLTKPFQIASRLLYYVYLGALVYNLFGQSGTLGQNLGYLAVATLLYFSLYFLFVRFAPIEVDMAKIEQEKQVEAERSKRADEQAEAHRVAAEALTEEQRSLQELYQYYERLHGEQEEKHEVEPETKVEEKHAVHCKHCHLKKDWRNHLPGQFDFVCEDCGRKVGFSDRVRKAANLLFFAVAALLMLPVIQPSLPIWIFFLASIGVLLLLGVAQQILLKRLPLEERE